MLGPARRFGHPSGLKRPSAALEDGATLVLAWYQPSSSTTLVLGPAHPFGHPSGLKRPSVELEDLTVQPPDLRERCAADWRLAYTHWGWHARTGG